MTNLNLKRLLAFWMIFQSITIPFAWAQDPFAKAIRGTFNGQNAFETAAFVEQRWRIAGNTGFNESIHHVVQILEKAGYILQEKAPAQAPLTYRIEKRPMSRMTWEPIHGKVEIVGDTSPLLDFKTNRNMIAINSASTPEAGEEGEVVFVGRGTSKELEGKTLAGKILFAEEGNLGGVYRTAIAKGALGVLMYSLPAYTQPEKNPHSIQFGGIPNTANGGGKWGILLSYAAKERLKKALEKGTVQLRVKLETKQYAAEELTLIAEAKGKAYPNERFVFSAHVQEPGANDNASGVGTLAEMARVTAVLIQKKQFSPSRTLTFLWGDEIVSTRRYITEDSVRARGIKWGVSLDMVGENTARTGGTFLIEKMPDPGAVWLRGPEKHTEWGGSALPKSAIKPHYFNDFLLSRCLAEAKGTNWVVKWNPFEGGSDHTPFLDANIPGLLMWHFTDQFYHTDGDRLINVSAQTMTHVGRAALNAAFMLISPNDKALRQTLTELENTALARLKAEFELSKAELQAGKSKTEQIEILTAWRDYYMGAVQKLGEIALNQPTATLQAQLNKSVQKLKSVAEAYLTSLAKP